MTDFPTDFDNYPTNRAETEPRRLAGPDVDEAFAALNAIQQTLGLDPAGTYATVADAIEAALTSGGGSGGHTIKDEGTPLTQRAGLNFTGAAVSVTDDAANDETDISIDAAPLAHDHDDRYYTEAETDTLLAAKANDADLTAHINDAADAHDASAISFSPAGSVAATTVQAAIEEVASESGGGGSAHVVKDEGVAMTQRANLDFQGAGVTVTDDAGNAATVVTIPGGGGSSGHIIEDEGVSLAGRSKLNFAGAGVTVTDDSADDATVVTVPGPDITQADLTAHINDAADAHDASAISVVPFSTIAATTVQAALEEIVAEGGGGGGGVPANAKGFVAHGSNAATARPAGFASVEWMGSVAPTNAIDNDTWVKLL